tara:strand:+ start:2255 stop:2482 length:228 start_codon:yes stop_codon:yes gene_type:complete
MIYKILLIFFLLLNNCSLNKDSRYWTENSSKNNNIIEKTQKTPKKNYDITKMTIEEYEIYIDEYTKKSKYPDISK